MQFEWDQFEERDSAGRVTGYGITWTEARVWAEWLLSRIAWGAYWLALMVLVAGLSLGLTHGSGVAVPMIVVAALLLGVATAFAWMTWRVPAAGHWIVFGRDGTIRTSKDGAWRTQVADIANIEWEELSKQKDETDLPYTHGVRFVTKRRRVLKVAKNLEAEDSGTLAYVLSLTKERAKVAGVNGYELAEEDAVW